MNVDLFIAYLQHKFQDDLFTLGLYQCILSFLVACFVAVVAIPVIIKISELKSLMEKPGERRSHTTPTPTFGGIAIYAGILIAYFLWPSIDQTDIYRTNLSVAGMTILFFIGIKDDLVGIDPNKKILFQVLAAMILIFFGELRVDYLYGILGFHHITEIISILLTCFIFIALTNAINLIDGIDGLAGGIATIASATFGGWFLLTNHFTMACLAFTLAGALIGFLRFNFSKTSKIFMGNTGSLIIGFMLAFFAVRFVNLNASFRYEPTAFFNAPIIAIVILIIPIFDTLRVFLVRILAGKSPFSADRNHMHHILLDNGLSHIKATAVLCGISLSNTVLFFLLHSNISNTQSLFILGGLFGLYMVISFMLKMRIMYVSTHPRRRMAVLRRELQSGIFGRRLVDYL
ncbi:glycosyltransferase family 4 protein [Spirosoma utsteinense]|uniref:UDP-N-acetylmuramyl pentapeptide phosphotransferase/UDP-N-acetylglucosamine-1-phosphate transferase n=1 Tax=Spirosoma utsteinense TaxID=2585773 RepID=A0ABR6W767_9BACT|nr:MraY family glycosyltransferase [Spirosoma utsteinense]MBC3786342.1 UDP-N-acetylmuramyl pentapeptide phosphotransferase/UDP-N-acetylglucosamine-1-phosphate transferase [Spirosoma utsteinense]MBC3791968.1 UDP-N-acetylmuramyl pentapeptide phosphotransferase/UDP-N-acetylglucosamine-1-phosphate transferase [Spirosoma utsteinense]